MLSTALELAAYAVLVVAGWLIAPFVGLIVLGVALLVIAHALDRANDAAPVADGGRHRPDTDTGRVRRPKVRLPRVTLPHVQIRRPGRREEVTP